jgi:hypothetical protein
MIFIDNKYSRVYYDIVNRAAARTLAQGSYKEKHHIVPRSFYSRRSKTGWLSGDSEDPSNLVYLTAKEHFICHMLLYRITEGLARYKMSFALKRFVYAKEHQQHMTSRKYQYIRSANAEQMRGKPCSPETREKIRQGNLKRSPPSLETRAKLSAAAHRRKGFTPEGLVRVVESNKNRVWTEEMKAKLRAHNLGKTNHSQKGIPQSRLRCPHCGLEGGTSAMKHWHFDRCRHREL